MSEFWRESVTLGLANAPLFDPYLHGPDCGCGQHAKAFPVSETELAAREPLIPALAVIERKFFRGVMKAVTKAETEILSGLDLPGISTVRRAVMTGERNTGEKWTWNREKEKALEDGISGLLRDVVGEPYDQLKTPKVKPPNVPLYTWWQLQTLAAGIEEAKRQIENASSHPPIVALIAADPDLLRFRAMQQAAGIRIRTELALDNLPEVKQYLEQMAIDGEWSINVARRLHNDIGEGQAWYWRRITRTEGTLANNLAYDLMSEANGVLYDEWMAGPTACIICTGFSGQVWKHGEGPYPVGDTHPHCGCVRIPQYQPGRGDVSPRWTRESPYDMPYTADELEKIRERLSTRRTDF